MQTPRAEINCVAPEIKPLILPSPNLFFVFSRNLHLRSINLNTPQNNTHQSELPSRLLIHIRYTLPISRLHLPIEMLRVLRSLPAHASSLDEVMQSPFCPEASHTNLMHAHLMALLVGFIRMSFAGSMLAFQMERQQQQQNVCLSWT